MPMILVQEGIWDMPTLIKALFPLGALIRPEGSGARPRARDAALPAGPGPAGPAAAPAAALRLEGNQQLGPGSLVVGVEVRGERRPGGPALADVTRDAEFVGNARRNPKTAAASEGRMVVGARFHEGAKGEAIAGSYRDNQNHGKGGMTVGYFFG